MKNGSLFLQLHQLDDGHFSCVATADADADHAGIDRRYQALYSYRLSFPFTTDAGVLNSLKDRSFQVEQVDFAREYFPD